MLTVKVMYAYVNNKTEEQLKQLAVPFAEYAVEEGFFEKASARAKDINNTLLPDIGVSFIDSESGSIFNVLVNQEQITHK